MSTDHQQYSTENQAEVIRQYASRRGIEIVRTYADEGKKSRKLSSGPAVTGQCLCGAVQFEMEYPAFWVWHDHSRAGRLAHGAVYATYVGTWRKRFRITAGEREINRFDEKETGAVRSFCRRCGTPLIYERARSRHMINIPRALFQSRTGRQPIYHIAIEEMQDWAYAGEPLVALKGYPGVFYKRSKKKSRVREARLSGSIGPHCS